MTKEEEIEWRSDPNITMKLENPLKRKEVVVIIGIPLLSFVIGFILCFIR